MEEIIRGAWHGLAPVDFNLAFLPERVATREMYRKLGFERRGTNGYRMKVEVTTLFLKDNDDSIR